MLHVLGRVVFVVVQRTPTCGACDSASTGKETLPGNLVKTKVHPHKSRNAPKHIVHDGFQICQGNHRARDPCGQSRRIRRVSRATRCWSMGRPRNREDMRLSELETRDQLRLRTDNNLYKYCERKRVLMLTAAKNSDPLEDRYNAQPAANKQKMSIQHSKKQKRCYPPLIKANNLMTDSNNRALESLASGTLLQSNVYSFRLF